MFLAHGFRPSLVYTQPSIRQISPTVGIWRMNEPADGGSICEVSGRCRAGEVSTLTLPPPTPLTLKFLKLKLNNQG